MHTFAKSFARSGSKQAKRTVPQLGGRRMYSSTPPGGTPPGGTPPQPQGDKLPNLSKAPKPPSDQAGIVSAVSAVSAAGGVDAAVAVAVVAAVAAVGGVGGAAATAVVGVLVVSLIKNLHRQVGVQEFEMPSAEFATKTPLSKWVEWDPEPKGDQVAKLDALAADRTAIQEIAVAAFARGKSIKSEGELFTRSTGDGHAYEIITKTVTIHEDRRAAAGDSENHKFLRGQLSAFPPFGRQLPQAPPQAEYVDADERNDDELTAESRFDRKIWDSNTPVAGYIALGRGGNVECDPSGVIHDRERHLIVRYGYMSTRSRHPLDGRALWVNVVNYQTGEMVGFHIGAGKNKVSTVDWLNQPIAAFVFVTMFRTWTWMLQQPGSDTPTLIGCDPPERQRLLTKLNKDEPNLAQCRKIASSLDLMAIGGSALRTLLGGNITGAPQIPKNTKNEGINE